LKDEKRALNAAGDPEKCIAVTGKLDTIWLLAPQKPRLGAATKDEEESPTAQPQWPTLVRTLCRFS
jgi:hypothetical protein